MSMQCTKAGCPVSNMFTPYKFLGRCQNKLLENTPLGELTHLSTTALGTFLLACLDSLIALKNGSNAMLRFVSGTFISTSLLAINRFGKRRLEEHASTPSSTPPPKTSGTNSDAVSIKMSEAATGSTQIRKVG